MISQRSRLWIHVLVIGQVLLARAASEDDDSEDAEELQQLSSYDHDLHFESFQEESGFRALLAEEKDINASETLTELLTTTLTDINASETLTETLTMTLTKTPTSTFTSSSTTMANTTTVTTTTSLTTTSSTITVVTTTKTESWTEVVASGAIEISVLNSFQLSEDASANEEVGKILADWLGVPTESMTARISPSDARRLSSKRQLQSQTQARVDFAISLWYDSASQAENFAGSLQLRFVSATTESMTNILAQGLPGTPLECLDMSLEVSVIMASGAEVAVMEESYLPDGLTATVVENSKDEEYAFDNGGWQKAAVSVALVCTTMWTSEWR